VPVQRPGPPLLIGGWGDRTLRVVARHADIWNVPGPPHNTAGYLAERARVLDAHCAAAGRDPATITRSTQTHVDYGDPAATRAVVRELAAAGFTHIVLNLRTPYPPGVARWLASEIIAPSAGV
jgi:alkanesulfonate monooxygenase SsuD/methylene tetrahydromethanopterin reductase-like flavin-dependent oxidoreductase (luciferase family)